MLAKARTNRWVNCGYFQKLIAETKTPLCIRCNTEDTTEHVINQCALHEHQRETMRLRLNHTGKVAKLLASRDENVIKELANFLLGADDMRKKLLNPHIVLTRCAMPPEAQNKTRAR